MLINGFILKLARVNIESQKCINNFRFDEAARIIYQFVWHSYCDWYIEFLKPIFDAKEKKNLEESRNMLSYIQSNILILLHPFIPFFTEKVWQDLKFTNYYKTPLMFKNWKLKPQQSFAKSFNKIDWLIDLITGIRSTKVDLNVSPGAFVDVSITELNLDNKAIIKDNLIVFKRLGRVTNVSNTELNNNGVKIIVGRETITLYFDQNLNLSEQKLKISSKIKDLERKTISIKSKLKNKSFLKNAPKQIIKSEKNALIDYEIELKKLNSIINSIKN